MLSNRSLLVRLLAPYLLVLVAVAVSLYAYGDRVVENLYLETLSESALRQAQLAGQLLPWNLRGAVMDARCAAVAEDAGVRVTVIAPDGTVFGDSEAASTTLENHGDRPEIRAAWRDGHGSDSRVSASVHRALFYQAWRQERGPDQGGEQRVIRLALPIAPIEHARQRIRRAIWGGVGIAALAALWPALVLSRRLSRRVARLTEFSNDVTNGREPVSLVPEADDIIGQLEANLVAMAKSLSAQLQAAREEKGKLEAVLSGMVEGVLVIDRRGTIRLSNQRAEQLFGASGGALVGQPLITVSRDPDLQALVREVTRGHGAPTAVREVTLDGGSGGEMLQVTATPIAEPAGEPQLFILVFHNVTELKKLETTRRDFVANVSHEIRTPLTAIRGYAETLRAGAINDPERAHQFLAVIERHAERLGRLTDDLLTLSDLELGRTALQRSAMPLVAAVDAAMEVVREKARRGQVEICHELPADLPALYADPDRVEQVLVNLIDNAVKYTSPGGRVTISGGVAERPENGGPTPGLRGQLSDRWIDIRVADTGIGVPKTDLLRLTERFYRVDKARSRELGGTGLGLAIVKHIVQAHGGTLRIESEVGHGTCVHVYLPAAEVEDTR